MLSSPVVQCDEDRGSESESRIRTRGDKAKHLDRAEGATLKILGLTSSVRGPPPYRETKSIVE